MTDVILEVEQSPSPPPPAPSTLDLIKQITNLGSLMAISDTFAIKGMLLPALLGRVDNSTESLASIALIITTINTSIVIGVSPTFCTNVLAPSMISQSRDLQNSPEEQAEKIHELTRLYRNGLLYSLFAMSVTGVVFGFSEPIFASVFMQNPLVAKIAADFLRLFIFAVPPTYFYSATLMFLQSFQYSRALAIGTASMVLCLALSFCLGFGYGFPQLGRDGILIGYIIEPYLTALAFGSILFCHPKFREFHFFSSLGSSLRGNLKHFIQYLKTGSVFTINVAAEMAFSFGLAAIAGLLSLRAQESLALVMQYTLANSILAVHFPLAGMIVLGDVMGSQDKKTIYKTAQVGLGIALLAGSIIPIVFGAAPRTLLSIFGKEDEEIAKILDVLAPIVSLGSLLDVGRMALIFQLRMVGDMRGSSAINVVTQLLGLGLTAGISLYSDLDVYGLGVGFSLSVALSCVILAQRWYSKMEPYRQEEPAPVNRSSCWSPFCFWKRATPVDEIALNQLNLNPT